MGVTPKRAERIAWRVVSQLRRERQRQKISNYALAQMTGLHQSTLSLIESGQRTPTIYTLALIAGALDVSLGEIVSDAESKR